MRPLRTLLIGAVLFPICLLLHELSHLGLLYLLGGSGALIVRPWRFHVIPAVLPSLHVTGAAGLPLLARLLFEGGGPGLVGGIAALLAQQTRGELRTALAANAAILFFFALVETADVLLDRAGLDLGLLTWEEFNYGVPLLLLLFAAAVTMPRRELAA